MSDAIHVAHLKQDEVAGKGANSRRQNRARLKTG